MWSLLSFVGLVAAQAVTISSVDTTGGGCPPDSTFVGIDPLPEWPMRTSATLGFTVFSVWNGNETTRKNDEHCSVRLNLAYPAACTIANIDVTYHGIYQAFTNAPGKFTMEYKTSTGVTLGPETMNWEGTDDMAPQTFQKSHIINPGPVYGGNGWMDIELDLGITSNGTAKGDFYIENLAMLVTTEGSC